MKSTLRRLAVGTLFGGAVLGMATPAQAYAPSIQDIVNTAKIRNDGAIALPRAFIRCDPAANAYYRYLTATVTQVVGGRVRTATATRTSDFTCRGTSQVITVTVIPRAGQPAWRVGPSMVVRLELYTYDGSAGSRIVRQERGIRTVLG